MNEKLYEKAIKIVEREKQKEVKEEVKEIYEELVWDSKKLPLTPKMVKEIKILEKKIWSFPCRRMWEDRYLGRMCAELRDMIETRRYHPKDLERLNGFAVKREGEECIRKSNQNSSKRN